MPIRQATAALALMLVPSASFAQEQKLSISCTVEIAASQSVDSRYSSTEQYPTEQFRPRYQAGDFMGLELWLSDEGELRLMEYDFIRDEFRTLIRDHGPWINRSNGSISSESSMTVISDDQIFLDDVNGRLQLLLAHTWHGVYSEVFFMSDNNEHTVQVFSLNGCHMNQFSLPRFLRELRQRGEDG